MREIKQNILPKVKKYKREKDYDYWVKHPSKKALEKLKAPTYQFINELDNDSLGSRQELKTCAGHHNTKRKAKE